MIITQKGVVDITPEYNRALRPVFCVSEGDKTSRQIVLTVMRGGEAFLIPSGATVYIIGKKSDSNIFTYRCNYSGPDVTFDITEQMSAASGIVLCELQINLSGEVLGSANFVYWTEPAPIENGTYSESDLNIMLEAIAGAERLDNFYAGIEDMVADAVEQIQIMPGQVVIDPTLLVNGAAADAAATGNAVRSFLNALITETTAEATIATCDDAAGGLPLKTLTANIVPAQAGSGDPSPENVRPISGYTGVTVTRSGRNILPNNAAETVTQSGVTFTQKSDGLHLNGKATENIYYNLITRNANAPTLKAGTYTLRPIASSLSYDMDLRISDVSAQSRTHMVKTEPATFTETEDMQMFCFLFVPSGATFSDFVVTPQLEAGTESTDYEPYNGATYPITFPTEAGVISGGILTVNSDGSGTLVVNQKRVTLTSALDWKQVGSIGTSLRTYVNFEDHAPMTDGWTYSDVKCSHLRYEAGNSGEFGTFNWTFAGNFTIKDANGVYGTLASLTQWLDDQNTAGTPVQLTYPIVATTYALSAVEVAQMLSGVNNVWTDAAGTVNIEYYANTAMYVEKIVNAQKTMIAGVEEEMTATKNYSIGDLLIVGTTLYRTTAAIASGAAITVGTNVTETTVAEQLLALA